MGVQDGALMRPVGDWVASAANHCGTPFPASRSSAVQSFGDEISAVRQSSGCRS